MKKIIILLLLSFSFSMYSQEVIEDEVPGGEIILQTTETEDYEEVETEPDEVPFSIVQNVPVYKGCDDASSSNSELKKCMSLAISNHVSKKFKTKMINGLDLPDGKVRINVMFKIDAKGNITDIKSRAPHPDLEKEAVRVTKSIPKMEKPGYQREEAVIVNYSFPIIFNIENKKYKAL